MRNCCSLLQNELLKKFRDQLKDAGILSKHTGRPSDPLTHACLLPTALGAQIGGHTLLHNVDPSAGLAKLSDAHRMQTCTSCGASSEPGSMT